MAGNNTIDDDNKHNQNITKDDLVEGRDYLKHTVQADTDTLQGLCLKYKINATQLRQANGGFSGDNLRLAPSVLYIPLNDRHLKKPSLSKEGKVHSLLAEFSKQAPLSSPEAQAYLEMNDGDLSAAKKMAREDLQWNREIPWLLFKAYPISR